MIELPPESPLIAPASIELHAAAMAAMLAHVYEHATQQLETFRPDPRVDEVLDVLFTATGALHDLSGHSSGPVVRKMLGEADAR